MTSLLYRGAVVLSADNLDEILVPNGLPIAQGVNGSITIPDALPGRVRTMSLYLCDSTQAPHFDTDPYWFYKVYPLPFHKVNFNKLSTNSDLLSSIEYYIDLMERIIIFYDDVIADTIEKEELYGITYNIDNTWGRVYYYVYSVLYEPDPTLTINIPILFTDAYAILQELAETYKTFLEAKYAEIYASGSGTARITMPNTNGIELFFNKPVNRFSFDIKKYKLGFYDNGLILYGSVTPRSASLNRFYVATTAYGTNPWPYKYSYEDTKINDTLNDGIDLPSGSLASNFTSLNIRSFSDYYNTYISGFDYYRTATDLDKVPILNEAVDLKYHQYHEVPYETYPDIIGVLDTLTREPDAKLTKTRTKQFYGETRTNSRTGSGGTILFQHNYYLPYTEFGYASRAFTVGETNKSQTKILANGLTEWRAYTPLHYGVRYVIRPTWAESTLSLWQSRTEDIDSLGSQSSSFPQKFIWNEDSENPLTLYIRSSTHIFNDPDDGGRVSFETTDESSVTPYTYWFGGSTQPSSLLKIKLKFTIGVYETFTTEFVDTFSWIRLRRSRTIPSIEYTPPIGSTVDDPPIDFNVSNSYTPSLSPEVYEDGILKQTGAMTFFSTNPAAFPQNRLTYRRWVTKEDDVLNAEHYVDEYAYNEITYIYDLINTYHLYTTQHHFSEPV